MFINRGGNPFVCLDEISRSQEPYNPVVFNPLISLKDNVRIIGKVFKKRFDTDLSENQISRALKKIDRTNMVDVVTSLQHLIVTNNPRYRYII